MLCLFLATAVWCRLESFWVDESLPSNVVNVDLMTKNDVLVSCEYEYFVVRGAAQDSASLLEEPRASLDELLRNYRGMSFELSTSTSGFSFRVEPFARISQWHGDKSYKLGNYAGWAADSTQHFTDGDECLDPDGKPANAAAVADRRATILKFYCGASARLLDVVEPRTCSYVAAMALPEVCGDSRFEQTIPAGLQPLGEGKGHTFRSHAAVPVEAEAWTLELFEVSSGEGGVVCRATLEEAALEPLTAAFRLSLSARGPAGSVIVPQIAYFDALTTDRRLLEAHQVALTSERHSLRSADDMAVHPTYLSVYTELK